MPIRPPLHREKLVAEYHRYGRPHDAWLVGAEFERHVLVPQGSPLPYFGRPGIHHLLEHFIADGTWKVKREGPFPIALLGGPGSITLEPGAQLELSGHPYRDLAAIQEDAELFSRQVDAWFAGTGVRQVALGFSPYADIPRVPWVPKGRYVIMREHMGRTGPLGHHMMKGTAATQASYDFADEHDCARKVKLATAIAPIVTALFANSPYTRGRRNGWATFRGYIWTQTDPARTGLPEAAADFSFSRWIDYLLDVPMMFVTINGQWLPGKGRTFRSWMEEGIDGHFPTEADWDLHQTSVFPEVRVKKQIEARMADCVSLPLAMAFVALFKGLFYCPVSLRAGEAIAGRFLKYGTRDARFVAACHHGLRAVVGGHPMHVWAGELVDAAREGLERCAPDEVDWLDPAERLIERRSSPAHLLLEQLGDTPSIETLARATHPLSDPTC